MDITSQIYHRPVSWKEKKIQHFTVTIIDRPEGALENALCYLKHICTQTMF